MRITIQPILTAGRLATCVLIGLLVAAPVFGLSADDTTPPPPSTTHKATSASHKASVSTSHKSGRRATAARSTKSGKARSKTAPRRHRSEEEHTSELQSPCNF